jgi:hypothetical protein
MDGRAGEGGACVRACVPVVDACPWCVRACARARSGAFVRVCVCKPHQRPQELAPVGQPRCRRKPCTGACACARARCARPRLCVGICRHVVLRACVRARMPACMRARTRANERDAVSLLDCLQQPRHLAHGASLMPRIGCVLNAGALATSVQGANAAASVVPQVWHAVFHDVW